VRSGFFVLLSALTAAVTLALYVACASGGSGATGGSGEGGGDGDLEGQAGDDVTAPSGDGSGPSIMEACNTEVSQYCSQLSMCDPYSLQVAYGDTTTCQTRLGPVCEDELTAPGTGWTPSGLEACSTALSKLTCQQFLYGRPQPKQCTPTGGLSNTMCLYDSQCGSGYCRIPSGSTCGNCVVPNGTSGACTTYRDCAGNLMCAGSECAAPSGLGGACNAMTPCELGLHCLGSVCIQPGDVGAGCDAAAECDTNLGGYCGSGACTAIQVVMPSSTCTTSPPTACYAGGQCVMGSCAPPVQDNGPCDAGAQCQPPSTCNSGACKTTKASDCASM
jgi:hypothetical protein